jgi:iron complex transport system ATP-binding protein
LITIKDIQFSIGQKQILTGISAQWNKGRFHAIVGPNGSGKSTLLKLLTGITKPSRGVVELFGKNIEQYSTSELSKLRAVLSQQQPIDFPLTVFEVIMMGRYPYFDFQPNKADEELVLKLAAQLSLTSFLDRSFQTLSGGEQQRVQFARVLAQLDGLRAGKQACLLLDEPLNNLDIKYQHQLLKELKAAMHEDMIVVAVIHDLNLALQYADTLSAMKEGELVFCKNRIEINEYEWVEDVFGVKVEMGKGIVVK